MSRLHVFEWEDQSWFPDIFRNFITDHLVFHVSRAYTCIVPLIAEVLKTNRETRIVDLCSGGGGPWVALEPALTQAMGEKVSILLSDYYPNTEAFESAKSESKGAINYIPESINAMDCPDTVPGLRTMFTALHHFKPEDAGAILEDAAMKRVPIALPACGRGGQV